MPVDMMIEAMKVAYTKSKSRHSMASLLTNSSSLPRTSQCELLDFPSFQSMPYQSMPGGNAEVRSVEKGKDFNISFFVKFYGSGTIRHYSDFGGSQTLMDKLINKHSSFASNLRQLARRNSKYSRCILVFTAHEMQIFSDSHQVSTDSIPLEQVYAVHPHPTKGRIFGVLADHSASGTVHCFCFMTTNSSTSTDVLCGFREACMHWLSRNLSREIQRDDHKETEIEEEESHQVLKQESMEAYLTSLFSFSSHLEKRTDLNQSESGCGAEGQASSRKVSFASSPYLDKVDYSQKENRGQPIRQHKETISSVNGCPEKNSKCKVYMTEPRLPQRTYPPPSSPHVTHETTHSANSLTTVLLDSESNDSATLEESLPLLVKKKTLSEMHPGRDEESSEVIGSIETPSHGPTDIDSTSLVSETCESDIKSTSDIDTTLFPFYTESEMSTGGTLTSEYYTPFQSFHDQQSYKMIIPDNVSSSVHVSSNADSLSVRSTSSAPSFLLTSSTQNCQCLTDDSSLSDFKAYLRKMVEESLGDIHTYSQSTLTPELSGGEDPILSSPKDFIPLDDISIPGREMCTTTNSDCEDQDITDSLMEGDLELDSIESSPEPVYRDITLSTLLEKIYPNLEDSLETSRESSMVQSSGNCDTDGDMNESMDETATAVHLVYHPSSGKSGASSKPVMETVQDTNVTQKGDGSIRTNISIPTLQMDKIVNESQTSSEIDLDTSCDSNLESSQLYSLEDFPTHNIDPSQSCSTQNATLNSTGGVDSLDITCDTDLQTSSIVESEASYSSALLHPFRENEIRSEGESQVSAIKNGGDESSMFTIPSLLLRDSSEISSSADGSVPLLPFKVSVASKATSTSEDMESLFTIPSLPLTTAGKSQFDYTKPVSSHETTGSSFSFPSEPLTGDDNTYTTSLSTFNAGTTENSSDFALPSLSLKIKAWSPLEKVRGSKRPRKSFSLPANIGSSSNDNSTFSITVMEPTKVVREDTKVELSEADLKKSSGSSTDSSFDLHYVTELLENSHDSLAKSVHFLCRRAIIKQSNISMELILPVKDLNKIKTVQDNVQSKVEAHLAKIQLNSSTVYAQNVSDVSEEDGILLEEIN